MKKILLTKSNNTHSGQKSLVMENDKLIYLKRKAMQPAYQELFHALFRLPDRQVHARVIDAINGTLKDEVRELCHKCLQKETNKNLVDASTQTTFPITSYVKDSTNSKKIPKDDTVDNSATITLPIQPTDSNKITESKILEDLPVVKKRKQRRSARLPQVIKKSQAKHMQQEQPKLLKRKSEVKAKNCDTIQLNGTDDISRIKRKRSMSVSLPEIEEAMSLIKSPEFPGNWQNYIKEKMILEFEKSEVIQPDGLLPIQSAIINNDYIDLRLQIYVWEKLKRVDLNEICTQEDEDCLQLAVIENKPYEIVHLLINSGLNLNSLDSQSNTIIHLAIINDIDAEVLNLLMEKIDLNMLLKFNDDGFTPLHLAVRRNSFLFAEIILNMIDKRSFDCVLYEREHENNDTKEKFLSFYDKHCEKLDLGKFMMQQSKEKQLIKRRVIDAAERRNGNTALFYAIENKLEHLIYFLLAHLADPRVKNHSGQNSRSYLSEFARELNLSIKIDRVMEKVENLLKN